MVDLSEVRDLAETALTHEPKNLTIVVPNQSVTMTAEELLELLDRLEKVEAENAALRDTSNWGILGTWLAEVGCYEGEYYNGHMLPGSDSAPIVDLSLLPGWNEKWTDE